MEDNDFDIQTLVQKYELMRDSGQPYYLDADEFAYLADYYNSHGDSLEAENIIRIGLQMHPENTELMIMNAKTMVFDKQYHEADRYLTTIADAEDIDLALLKIECKLHLDEPEIAEQIKDEMLSSLHESDDDYYFFITELGFLYNDVDRIDDAITYLEKSFELEKNNHEVLIDLAYAYEMKSKFNKAIEYNNLLLDSDPYSFDAWLNIGKLYSINGQYDKALDAFDFALTINENDTEALKMKALSLYFNDNIGDAIHIFEKCIAQNPLDESLYDSLLECYETIEQYDKMLKLINRKVETFGISGAVLARARVYFLKGELDRAQSLFQQIPIEEQDTLAFHMLEGEIAFYNGDYRASEAAYIKASLLSPENEEIIDRLANVSVAQEKYEQAAEYLEQLLKLEPTFPSAKSRLAFIRFEIGEKQPFDNIVKQFSDNELRDLLKIVNGGQDIDYSALSRKQVIMRLNEARENRVLFKNIKY